MSKTIINADKLLIKLINIGNVDMSPILTKAALIVERDAKINCPKDTGELRASITHTVDKDKAEIGTNLKYAPYVEFGTGLFSSLGTGRTDVPWVYCDAEGNFHSTIGQHPQPYLMPALQNNKAQIEQIIDTELSKEIKNIAKR